MMLADSSESVVPIPGVRNRIQVELPVGAVAVDIRHELTPDRASPLYTGLRLDHYPLNICRAESNSGASPPYNPVPRTIVRSSVPRALSLVPWPQRPWPFRYAENSTAHSRDHGLIRLLSKTDCITK